MIFISYRKDDSKAEVEHLDTRLAAEFGRGTVFRDKKRLAGGDQWPDVLEQQAKTCQVMLVVIGAKWQTAAYPDDARLGQLRLHDTNDWVRKEITLALDHGTTVIPVMLNGQKTPHRAWLGGCGLGRLADCQGVKLRTDEYDADFATLAETVRKYLPAPPPAPSPPPPPRVWPLAEQYPLHPAPHFAGRTELMKELSAWAVAPNDPVRVRAIVAVGGTGKTAVAERVLAGLPDENPFGVFVWSFDENRQTEAFLRAACDYFLGEAPTETVGLLERLQRGLRAAGRPHLLILDGLELIQATGTTSRPRGELEDPLMRLFLRGLAAGRGMRAKALVTSRFPLPDLEDWTRGFKSHELDDLDAGAARAVLRDRGVEGSEAELDGLAESVHGHALTVDVLGLYLRRFANGDPKAAAKFDLKAFRNDQKAERLSKVLTSYSAMLPNDERDLLARLSLFPRHATVGHLGFVTAAGGEVAGSLIGYDSVRLRDMLEGLRKLGLVFRADTREGETYSVHPFLRDFFRGMLGATSPEQVHEAVRQQIAGSLEERPSEKPTDPADLDRYERVIEATLLAGKPQDAFDLYWYGLGGYTNLSWDLGEFSRGLRIVKSFSPDQSLAKVGEGLTDGDRARLLDAWGQFVWRLGDLAAAEAAFGLHNEIRDRMRDFRWLCRGRQYLASVALDAGRWPKALTAAEGALALAPMKEVQLRAPQYKSMSLAFVATALARLGRVAQAREVFVEAGRREPLSRVSGTQETEFKFAIGRREAARAQAEANRRVCLEEKLTGVAVHADTQLARCALPDDIELARVLLASARVYSGRTESVSMSLRCYHLAAEIARHAGDYPQAVAEAQDGIQLADSCGFGRWSLDIRAGLAKTHLDANEPQLAIDPAQWVLKRSQEPDCQYAWGVADSLHLLGVAYSRLGETEKARDHLSRAIEKRRPLEHPGLSESEAELGRLV